MSDRMTLPKHLRSAYFLYLQEKEQLDQRKRYLEHGRRSVYWANVFAVTVVVIGFPFVLLEYLHDHNTGRLMCNLMPALATILSLYVAYKPNGILGNVDR